LIQVNTKDIPNKNFFNAQVGVGGNSITMGQEFKMQKGGKWDFLELMTEQENFLPNACKKCFQLLVMQIKRIMEENM
jgi:hypothetical protein